MALLWWLQQVGCIVLLEVFCNRNARTTLDFSIKSEVAFPIVLYAWAGFDEKPNIDSLLLFIDLFLIEALRLPLPPNIFQFPSE